MLRDIWIAGALWLAVVCVFLSWRKRHADPEKFWSEAVQMFLVLAGLFTVVEITSWFAIWLAT